MRSFGKSVLNKHFFNLRNLPLTYNKLLTYIYKYTEFYHVHMYNADTFKMTVH